MEKEQIVILHSRPYSFVNKETGELLEGVKVTYIMTGFLSPVELGKGEKGYITAQNSLSLDKLSNLVSVPGVYNPIYSKTVNNKGQVIQKLVDVEFVDVFGKLKQ